MNQRNLPVLVALLTVLMFGGFGEARAQANPDQVHRRNNCRLAEQVIRTGHPANKTAWAWDYVGYCPRELQVPLLVARMQQARRSTDEAFVSAALLRASTLRDATLFREVLGVAGDPEATEIARVYAFLTLDALRDPSRAPDYELFVRLGEMEDTSVGPCSTRRSHPTVAEEGVTPLPANYRDQIAAIAARTARDDRQPRPVRGAARCLL